MRFSSSALASLMLLAGTVAFIATAVGEYLSLGELVARGEARAHALRAQLLIRRTGMLLVDLETGQRGFAITGEAAFLEPYERASHELEAAQQALRRHLSEGGATPAGLQRLEELSRQRVAQIERNVAKRWAVGEQVLKDLQSYVAGKRLMDEIRGELFQLESVQDQRIRQAEQGMQAVQERTTLLAAVLPGVGCVLIGAAALSLRYERRRRDQAEQALLQVNAGLESKVAKRTAELRGALARIRSFASELDDSIEAERRRLAREVHDQIGQVGTATKMLTLGLRRKLGPEYEGSLGELLALADEAINTARSISAALRPPLLDDFGLASAIEHYAKSLALQGELQVDVDVQGDAELTAVQANQLFRIMQEASTNVLRHARATQLSVHGRRLDAGYLLEIIDDGQGPGSVRADASGLRNMRERAAMVGGSFEFGPGLRGGTRVGVQLPLGDKTLMEEGGCAS